MLPWQLLGIVLFVFGPKLLKGVSGQETACLPDNQLNDGGIRCLSLIRQKAVGTSAFPFSTPFSTLCPPEERESRIQCFRTQERLPLDQPYSLSMLAFGSQCLDDSLSGLDRYLDVQYTSPPGNFTGCDYVFSTEDVIRFRLDPLSDSSVGAWFTRQLPTFTWHADRDELFTLLFVDIEGKLLHGAFANIRGNDVVNSMVLKEYMGSINMRPIPRVFTFLLYKQRGEVESEPLPRQGFNLTRLVKRFKLEGPVGINWLMVEADAYSVQNANSLFGIQNCALMIQKALEKNSPDLPFLTRPYDLKVHLRVRFTTDELTHGCGILSITHLANDFFLDPIGNPIINRAFLTTESTRTFYMQMNKVNPNNLIDFVGKLYTLMSIDADVPALHGLIINIHSDDVASGTEILPYSQPGGTPFIHTYYFLLYEQEAEINLNATSALTQTTCPINRCLDGVVQAFISLNKLQLVGATWMRPTNDDYVECFQ